MRKNLEVLVSLAVVIASLVFASVAFSKDDGEARTLDEPKASSLPSIRLSDDKTRLIGDNGGWFTNSGNPVQWYVFRFFRDGALVQGAASVPKTAQWQPAPLAGQYPDDPNANIYTLQSGDYGHQICLDLYAGVRDTYYYSWGELAYDVLAWGHRRASDDSEIPLACITPVAPSAPPPPTSNPNPSAALAVFTNVTLPARRAAKLYATWKNANPREAAALETYDAAILNRQKVAVPTPSTPTGRTFVATDEQAAWDAGVHQ